TIWRSYLASGIDPSAKKQADNKTIQEKRNNTRAFKTVAKSWFATKTTWSEDYQHSVWTRLETYLFPDIGNKDIAELDTGDLLAGQDHEH
ncbi:phage integrase central domain-containing protein, partial [Pectobacterium aquaticum]